MTTVSYRLGTPLLPIMEDEAIHYYIPRRPPHKYHTYSHTLAVITEERDTPPLDLSGTKARIRRTRAAAETRPVPTPEGIKAWHETLRCAAEAVAAGKTIQVTESQIATGEGVLAHCEREWNATHDAMERGELDEQQGKAQADRVEQQYRAYFDYVETLRECLSRAVEVEAQAKKRWDTAAKEAGRFEGPLPLDFFVPTVEE